MQEIGVFLPTLYRLRLFFRIKLILLKQRYDKLPNSTYFPMKRHTSVIVARIYYSYRQPAKDIGIKKQLVIQNKLHNCHDDIFEIYKAFRNKIAVALPLKTGNSSMAIRCTAFFFVILLVVIFCWPKLSCFFKLRGYF